MRGHVRNRNKGRKARDGRPAKPNWCYVIDIGYDECGKRRQVWCSGFATQREAEEAMHRHLAQIAEGADPGAAGEKKKPRRSRSQLTVAEYLMDWLGRRRDQLRGTSESNYRWIFKAHVIPEIGNILLAKLNSGHIQELYAKKAGYALNTRQRIHGVLRTAMQDAVEAGLINHNPVEKKLCPKQRRDARRQKAYTIDDLDTLDEIEFEDREDKRVAAMNDEELNRFLSAVRGTRFYAAHLLAARRGLRRGEVLGLRWRDIDFRHKTLTVRRSLVVVDGKLAVHPPKTERGRRTIVLSDELLVALKEHQRRQNEEKMRRRNTHRDRDLVFATQDGGFYDPNRFVQRHFKKYLKRAGLTEYRFHDLRHTAATMMLRDGVDLKVASQILGHASEAFTLQVYGHVLTGMQEAALARYDG